MRKILNQLDSLETVLPVEFADFLTFLRAFKKVRDAAFNSVSYDRNCPIYINEVVTSLEALKQFGVTFIPKFHLLHHVATFCEKQDAPLGLYGDQGVERVHQVYEKVWNRFKVNSTDNPHFEGQLLAATATYNYDQMFKLALNKKKRQQKQREE